MGRYTVFRPCPFVSLRIAKIQTISKPPNKTTPENTIHTPFKHHSHGIQSIHQPLPLAHQTHITMDIRQFSQRVAAKQRQIAQLLQRRLPVVVGRLAKKHYQDNFRQSGFVDHGLHPWQPAKRQNGGAGTYSRYRTLLSSRNHLFSSINYTPANASVTVYNNVPYAAAHNDGATVNIRVTPKMRRFAWAKFYEASGKRKNTKKTRRRTNPRAQFWRNLALTKKTTLTVRIPQRRFIGPSYELNQKIDAQILKELRNILNT